ncbi:MAG TPA: winged helix-turn-helix domain-containing protein, partial [Terriglobia bacterium]|nr:winged helix-turn-helix domain-containing protein [Terriglobia bacterium]
MKLSPDLPHVVRFDRFEVDLRSGELRQPGSKTRLQDQPLQILALLLEHAGQVVTREELEKRLWPDGVVVDFEHSINSAVKRLRKALDDDAEHPRYIETLPRLGYRFNGQVEFLGRLRTVPPAARPVSEPAEAALPIMPEGPLPDQTSAVGVRKQNMFFARQWDGKLFYAMGTLGMVLVFALAVVLDIGGLRDRLLWSVGAGHGVPLPKIESIAVLPFENLSGDPQQEYLADGMTDGLVTNLGKIGALRVISRTTAMHYKGTTKPLPEIARELRADAIVEGTMQRPGNHLLITVNLLYAPADRHLWSERYERDLGDVLVLQSEVARAIA